LKHIKTHSHQTHKTIYETKRVKPNLKNPESRILKQNKTKPCRVLAALKTLCVLFNLLFKIKEAHNSKNNTPKPNRQQFKHHTNYRDHKLNKLKTPTPF